MVAASPASDLFEPAGPRSVKVRCVVCGHTGYPGGHWQRAHVAGHAPCRGGCGKMLTLLQDGNPRMHQRGACGVPRPVPHSIVTRLATWSGLAEDEVEQRLRAALLGPEGGEPE